MSTKMRRSIKFASIFSVLLILSACGGSGPVTASLSDTSIQMSRATTNAGKVAIAITNTSKQKHEFVVVQTDLAEDQLPKNADGEVDEEKLTSFGEQGDIEPGKTADLTVDLHPGRYIMLCNLPGHYAAGMHTVFTVSQ